MPKATPIKFSLKNVKFHRGHDGGVGLNADIYVDGKKIAHVYDDAWGGGNQYDAFGKTPEERKTNRKIIEDLETYAKTRTYVNPLIKDKKPMTKNLDILIDEALDEMEKEKLAKKSAKKFATHIITGVPGGDATMEYSYGKPARQLSTIPVQQLQTGVDSIKAKLKAGERILNTNLEALGIVL
jgi:hypothetical protein